MCLSGTVSRFAWQNETALCWLKNRDKVQRVVVHKLIGILLISLLTACGFRPMYGSNGETTSALRQDLAAVFVETIPERSGQVLRNRLIEQLGFGNDPVAPSYTFSVQLVEAISALGIREDATSSYGRLTITARYILTDTATGKPILTDTTRAFSGFPIVDSEYAALTAQRDARQKVLQQLAETLARRVTVKLGAVQQGQTLHKTSAHKTADHETERR